MELTLKVWRQKNAKEGGKLVEYKVSNINEDSSFLEMLDFLNEDLMKKGEEPIAFEHDCREGICGTCGVMINGVPHGPEQTTTCQLHMRSFKDGDTITIEPWRAKPFPVLKDLVVDRAPFDRIIRKGGFVSIRSGSAQDANAIPVEKAKADLAFEAAACIGCGACVAACKNASASLFVSAKVAHFALLPQGQPESKRRTLNMVKQMDEEGFGSCTNQYECQAACPKDIDVRHIGAMNRQFVSALVTSDDV